MTNLVSPDAITPLRQAIEAAKSTAGGAAELDALEAELRAAEKDLLPKAASGDVQAGATITMNRFKLEAIPAERERILGEHPKHMRSIWDATSKTIADLLKSAQSIVEVEGEKIQAEVAPVLAKLLEARAHIDLRSYAMQTKMGRLADSLASTLRLIDADHPSVNLNALKNKNRDEGAEAERVILRKAERVIKAVEEFQGALR